MPLTPKYILNKFCTVDRSALSMETSRRENTPKSSARPKGGKYTGHPNSIEWIISCGRCKDDGILPSHITSAYITHPTQPLH